MHLDQFSCKHFFQHLVCLNLFKAAALIIFLEKKKKPEDTGKYGKPTLDSSVIALQTHSNN